MLLLLFKFLNNFRDWESANGTISAMTNNGLEPDADTYRELLCGYAKHGVSSSVSSLIGIFPPIDSSYSLFILNIFD